MRVDRFNGGTLRRYHVGAGAVCIVIRERGKPRLCRVIPACFPVGVVVDVPPEVIAQRLREVRKVVTL